MLSNIYLAEICSGSPTSGPEALLHYLSSRPHQRGSYRIQRDTTGCYGAPRNTTAAKKTPFDKGTFSCFAAKADRPKPTPPQSHAEPNSDVRRVAEKLLSTAVSLNLVERETTGLCGGGLLSLKNHTTMHMCPEVFFRSPVVPQESVAPRSIPVAFRSTPCMTLYLVSIFVIVLAVGVCC